MPDPPAYSKREPQRANDSLVGAPHAAFPYAELHCKTNFSFLEGAAHPDELVVQANALGYRALAITDRNSLAGVVRAHAAAKESHLKLLIGAEITPTDAPPLIMLATDRAAYGRLSRLITLGRRRAPKGECELTLDDLASHSEGLLACLITEPGDAACDLSGVLPYQEIFDDRCYLLAELHYATAEKSRLSHLIELSKQSRVPLVAAGDVHYHTPDRMALQHVLTAIRNGTTVTSLGDHAFPNAERHLRTLDEIHAIFNRVPDALRRTVEVANRCTFSLDELRYEYPEELAPSDETPMQYLRNLAWKGAEKRYRQQLPEQVRQQLEKELNLIEELNYEAFFLTVYDLVEFAKSQEILCQGRGSAANSTVCYCLGVTAVDPLETDLLFERFVSRERNEAPDIDVDFEHERREEVLQYVYRKYGRERAGLTAVVTSYRLRSAVRDVGKALGLSLDRVDALAKHVDFRSESDLLPKRCGQAGIEPESRLGRQFITLVNQLIGFPRHLSQHVGGMVITRGPLCELVPIENAAMADRTVIQWDKDDLAELGVLKVDCLALGMLTAIHKCFDLVEKHHSESLAISDFVKGEEKSEDKNVYEMISRADTVGVFQIESRAQMSMLPRLRPSCFYDLVIEVAIVRPGPIQGDMVHPYLRRRELDHEDLERELQEDSCFHPELRKVLQRTLGVPLFQEQAMQVAIVAAGFKPDEADQLRRAMGGWRRPGLIDNFRQKLIDGMRQRGFPEDFAARTFKQISGFGEYGFPESHAASFAKLVYVSAWLKYHYPAAFVAAMINSQPMGFYAPAQLIRDAAAHGVEVLPIDVNESRWDCTLQTTDSTERRTVELPPKVRLGMCLVRGLPRTAADAIVQARTTKFRDMADLTARCQLNQSAIERLAAADAFGSLQLDRRSALWQALGQDSKAQDLPLFASDLASDSSLPQLPRLSSQEEVFADYGATGLTLRQHPMTFYREKLDALGVVPAGQLPNCEPECLVQVAGIVLLRQRPSTARGVTFVTLEDETGISNLVIFARTWQRFDNVARRATGLIARGKLERKNDVLHIIVQHLEDISARLGQLAHHSRDFR